LLLSLLSKFSIGLMPRDGALPSSAAPWFDFYMSDDDAGGTMGTVRRRGMSGAARLVRTRRAAVVLQERVPVLEEVKVQEFAVAAVCALCRAVLAGAPLLVAGDAGSILHAAKRRRPPT